MSNNAEIIDALRAFRVTVAVPSQVSKQGVVIELERLAQKLKLYSWEVRDNGLATGRERAADERRIQVIASNTQRIDVGSEEQVLVLGWCDEFTPEPIIVAFNPFGVADRVNGKIDRKLRAGATTARASDSQQFRQGLLNEAVAKGMAVDRNQHGEAVIAFKPDRFVDYVAKLRPKYHNDGDVRKMRLSDENNMEELVLEAERENASPVDDEDQAEPTFDPNELDDARRRVAREIAIRQGQPAFRARLVANYRRCVVTGSNQVEVLEAAHIVPYSGPGSNHISNGLLLRADIHTLFDLGLLTIDESNMTVRLSARLAGSEYETLQGRPLWLQDVKHTPSKEALRLHRARARD
jgi:hypothetical protein